MPKPTSKRYGGKKSNFVFSCLKEYMDEPGVNLNSNDELTTAYRKKELIIKIYDNGDVRVDNPEHPLIQKMEQEWEIFEEPQIDKEGMRIRDCIKVTVDSRYLESHPQEGGLLKKIEDNQVKGVVKKNNEFYVNLRDQSDQIGFKDEAKAIYDYGLFFQIREFQKAQAEWLEKNPPSFSTKIVTAVFGPPAPSVVAANPEPPKVEVLPSPSLSPSLAAVSTASLSSSPLLAAVSSPSSSVSLSDSPRPSVVEERSPGVSASSKAQIFDLLALINKWKEKQSSSGIIFKELLGNLKPAELAAHGLEFVNTEPDSDSHIAMTYTELVVRNESLYNETGEAFLHNYYEDWVDLAIRKLSRSHEDPQQGNQLLENEMGMKVHPLNNSSSDLLNERDRLLEKLREDKEGLIVGRIDRNNKKQQVTLAVIKDTLDQVSNVNSNSAKKPSCFSFFSSFNRNRKKSPEKLSRLEMIKSIYAKLDNKRGQYQPDGRGMLTRLNAIQDIYLAARPESKLSRLKNSVFGDKETNQFCKEVAKLIEKQYPDVVRALNGKGPKPQLSDIRPPDNKLGFR